MTTNNWFEVSVKYIKNDETGKQKKVTEKVLVEALSCTEGEARATEEMEPYISGEFTVSAVKTVNISEIFYDSEGDRWYKVKVLFITLDEKTGIEKESASYMLVQAADFEKALKNLLEGMKGTVSDFRIAGISETNITEVFETESK